MVRGDLVLVIPGPHRGDVGVELLRRILRRAEICREDWLASGE